MCRAAQRAERGAGGLGLPPERHRQQFATPQTVLFLNGHDAPIQFRKATYRLMLAAQTAHEGDEPVDHFRPLLPGAGVMRTRMTLNGLPVVLMPRFAAAMA